MRDLLAKFPVTLLALAVAVVPAVRAEDEATDEIEGQITVGGQSVEDLKESSKFQEHGEVPNGFFLHSFNLRWSQAERYFDVGAIDLLQDDQRVTVTLGKIGTFRLALQYDQTPKWFSNTAATPFTNEGNAGYYRFSVPQRQGHENFVAGTYPTLASLIETELATASAFPDLRYRRDTATADLRWTPREFWTFNAGFLQERRAGTAPLSVGPSNPGGDTFEFASGIDYTTHQVRGGVEYAKPTWHVGGGIEFHTFENDLRGFDGTNSYGGALVLDNPLRATDALAGGGVLNPGASRFLISRPPDNTAHSINVNAGMRVSDWGHLSGLVSLGRYEQNERLLPFSLHSAGALRTTTIPDPLDAMATISVPVEVRRGSLYGPTVSGFDGGGRYDGQVDTKLYDLRFTGRPTKNVNFKVFARSYDYDNQTPEYFVTDYVSADTSLSGRARAALPMAWKKDNVGIDGRYRPFREISFDLGYEQEKWDREFRSTDESSEDIFRAGVHWTPSHLFNVRAKWRHGDRSYNTYDEENFVLHHSYPEGESVANAVILQQRALDLADRKQDRWDVMAEILPNDRLTFGLTLSRIDNDYAPRTVVDPGGPPEVREVLGRLSDQTQGWALDFSYAVNDRIGVYGDYGEEVFEYDLASRYRPVTANVAIDDPLNNWFSSIEDTSKSYGIGVNAELVPDRWILDLSCTVADARGITLANGVPGGVAQGEAVDYPNVSNKLTNLTADARYTLKKDLTLGFAYIYEKFELDDFARDVMQPWMGAVDTAAGESYFLGYRVPDYDINIFRVLLNYRF